ncbi:MAG: Cellulase [Actinomycetota bacterium]|nr:Cellulase [Actinomycetota bacterium]
MGNDSPERKTSARSIRSRLGILASGLGVTALALSVTQFAGVGPGADAASSSRGHRATVAAPTGAAAPVLDRSSAVVAGASGRSPSAGASRTSLRWTFPGGNPQGWFAVAYSSSRPGPWLDDDPEPADTGPAGVLVGDVRNDGDGVGIDVNEGMLRAGWYRVTARVRMAPGQPTRKITFLNPWERLVQVPFVTDRAWSTITTDLMVPSGGETVRLSIGPGNGSCDPWGSQIGTFPSAFRIGEVSAVLTGPATPRPPFTPPACTTPPYTPHYTPGPTPQAQVRYEITRVRSGGFSASFVITNLLTTPITGWSLNANFSDGQRITWASGASVRSGSDPGSHVLTGIGAFRDLPAQGSVRISFSARGTAMGTGDTRYSLPGIPSRQE